MSNKVQYDVNTSQQFIGLNVYNITAASGTYQVPAADMSSLHVIVADGAIFFNRGTGGTVTVTSSNGTRWPADGPMYFHPVEGGESFGWAAASGSVKVTIAKVSR